MEAQRVIGPWTMTSLVVNSIIGSAIFGVPSEAIRLVGRRSPTAMVIAAVLMGIIILPSAEVASRFSRAGGLYLYARTTFGRFVGLQVGWFWLLAIAGGGAAGINLFLNYSVAFHPAVNSGWPRFFAIFLLVLVPATANYVGVRQGAHLGVIFTLAKLVPLGLVIGLGLFHLPKTPTSLQGLAPAWSAWPKVLLLLFYSFSGWEDTLLPTGEVKHPERTLPFALLTGLGLCALIYTSFQFVIVQIAGTAPSSNGVIDTASALPGSKGVPMVSAAVMVSTFGWLSGAFLNSLRFPLALAEHGDSPEYLGRLHPRLRTRRIGVVLYALVVFALAITGSFIWAVELTAGALTIFYSVTCLALFRLRKLDNSQHVFRMPFGRLFAAAGIAFSGALLAQLELRQIALMSLTCILATANWFWARGRAVPPDRSGVLRTYTSPLS